MGCGPCLVETKFTKELESNVKARYSQHIFYIISYIDGFIWTKRRTLDCIVKSNVFGYDKI